MTTQPRGPEPSTPFRLSMFESVRAVGKAAWDAIVPADAPPFMRFEWFDALEQTGCIAEERGWLAAHFAIYAGQELVLLAPAYVKNNSEGEFIFDHAWARFAEHKLHLDYYPKLILAVPFTPATGPRVFMRSGFAQGELMALLAAGIQAFCQQNQLSGVHVLFPQHTELPDWGNQGYFERLSLQFHWQNAGYQSFADFLQSFTSKRRNQIRRELRALSEQNLELEAWSGAGCFPPEAVDFIYNFYTNTVDKFVYGRRYLNRAFFESVCHQMPERLHVVVAKETHTRRPIAGAFNLLSSTRLYGRYWGALEERPFLHFNVCFYKGIEECIQRRLQTFEPGAGGEHKLARGFAPTLTHSAHLLFDERLRGIIADYQRHENASIAEYVKSGAEPENA